MKSKIIIVLPVSDSQNIVYEFVFLLSSKNRVRVTFTDWSVYSADSAQMYFLSATIFGI